MAGLDRPYEAQHVFPLLTDDVGADTLAQQRGDGRIGRDRRDRREPPVGEVAQARAEAKSQHRAQGEDMIGRPAGVGVMLDDPEIGAVAGEAVEDIRSEEHTSELQSIMRISYAVFCLQKNTSEPLS